MKKLTLLLLLILAQPLQAQWVDIQNTVPCGPFRDVVATLTHEKYKETPLWVGQSGGDVTSFALFTNADTGSWTVIQYHKQLACIMGAGSTSNIVNLAPFGQKY